MNLFEDMSDRWGSNGNPLGIRQAAEDTDRMRRSIDALRPGPDANDDPQWENLPSTRRSYLLVAGERNDKMRTYLDAVERKPSSERSPLEQMTTVVRILSDFSSAEAGLGTPPAPLPCPSATVWKVWAGLATCLCFALLVFMMWRQEWRHPFRRCRMPAVIPDEGVGRGWCA